MASSEAPDAGAEDEIQKGTEVLLQTEWECQRNKKPAKLIITDAGVEIVADPNSSKSAKHEGLSVGWLDILGVEEGAAKKGEAGGCLVLHHIHKKPSKHWQPAHCRLAFPSTDLSHLVSIIKDRCHTGKPKRLLVIINPVSGRSKAQTIYKNKVAPLFQLASVQTDVIVTEGPKHAEELTMTYDFTAVDGVICVGGDGLYHQVLNGMVRRSQTDAGAELHQNGLRLQPLPVPLGIIPCGTGNGVAQGQCGVVDPVTSALHIIRGVTSPYNVASVHYHDGTLIAVSIMMIGYGEWARLIKAAEEKRYLGVARYPVVMFASAFSKWKTMRCTVEYLQPEDLQGDNSEGAEASSRDFPWRKADLDDGAMTNILNFTCNFEVSDESKFVIFPGSDTFMSIIDKPCSRTQQLKNMVYLFKNDPSFFQGQTRVSLQNIMAWRVRRLEQGAAAASASSGEAPPQDYEMVNIDGEFLQLNKPEIAVWLHPRYVQMFTSRDLTKGVPMMAS